MSIVTTALIAAWAIEKLNTAPVTAIIPHTRISLGQLPQGGDLPAAGVMPAIVSIPNNVNGFRGAVVYQLTLMAQFDGGPTGIVGANTFMAEADRAIKVDFVRELYNGIWIDLVRDLPHMMPEQIFPESGGSRIVCALAYQIYAQEYGQ